MPRFGTVLAPCFLEQIRDFRSGARIFEKQSEEKLKNRNSL